MTNLKKLQQGAREEFDKYVLPRPKPEDEYMSEWQILRGLESEPVTATEVQMARQAHQMLTSKYIQMLKFLDTLIEKTVSAVEESVVPPFIDETPHGRTEIENAIAHGQNKGRASLLQAFKTFRNHD